MEDGMIELMPGLPENVLGLSAKGEVTGDDYERTLIPAVNERTKRHGKIRLLYHLGPAFTGYTASAMWDDAKLGVTHLFDFERIAVVTDVEWCRVAVRLFAPLIPCPVRLFRNAELATAEDWVKS
jgi:SpoIIAA-like